MTMFYSDRDLRLLEEKRLREIVREEIQLESAKQVKLVMLETNGFARKPDA